MNLSDSELQSTFAFEIPDAAPAWTPELPPEIVKRLAAVHIQCVAVHWSGYFQWWQYDLVRTHNERWTYAGNPSTWTRNGWRAPTRPDIRTMTASGVMAMLQRKEMS